MYEKINRIEELEIGRYIKWKGNGGFLVRINENLIVARKGKYFVSCKFDEQEIEQKLTLDECILLKLNELCDSY